MTEAEIRKVNDWRTLQYTGSSAKTPLSASPGIRYLVYGKDIYWNFERLAVQVEDVMDCLECLYPHLQFLLEFDHSSGHTKKKPDGLFVENMNLGVRVSSKKMRSSKMTEGCLAAHNPLNINMEKKNSDGTKSISSIHYYKLAIFNISNL